MKGFKTYVAQIPSAGSYDDLPTSAEIYDYIYNVYHTGTKTSYVLIVGDDATEATRHFYEPNCFVPSNICLFQKDDETYVPYLSDHPYACVEGGDDLADLTIGRLPVSISGIPVGEPHGWTSKADLGALVEKLLTYDRYPVEGDWYGNALMAGVYTDVEGGLTHNIEDFFFMETTMYADGRLGDEQCADMNVQRALILNSNTTTPNDPFYYNGLQTLPHRISSCLWDGFAEYQVDPSLLPPEGSWTDDKEEGFVQAHEYLIDGINGGVGLVAHVDHWGVSTGWTFPSFFVYPDVYGYEDPPIPALSNNGMTPVVLSMDSHSGNFGRDEPESDSLAEALLRHTEGGAVGVVAPTQNVHPGYDDLLMHGIFTGLWGDDEETGYDPEYGLVNNPYPMQTMRPAEALNFAKYYMAGYMHPYVDEENPGFDLGGVCIDDDLVEPGRFTKLKFYEYHWFGDPEMMLRTKTPIELTVGPLEDPEVPGVLQSVNVGGATDYTVTVTVPDPENPEQQIPLEGAQVCISRHEDFGDPEHHREYDYWSEDYWVGTTGGDGTVEFDGLMTHEIGEYHVVVTGFNADPYEGEMESLVSADAIVVDADLRDLGAEENWRNDGEVDQFLVERDWDYLEVKVLYEGDWWVAFSAPFDQVDENQIFINGSRDDDRLIVDLGSSAPAYTIPAGGICYRAYGGVNYRGYDEQAHGDTLEVKGGSVTNAVYSLTDLDSGEMVLDGSVITFSELELPEEDGAAAAMLPADVDYVEVNLDDSLYNSVELVALGDGDPEPAGPYANAWKLLILCEPGILDWWRSLYFSEPNDLLRINFYPPGGEFDADDGFDVPIEVNGLGLFWDEQGDGNWNDMYLPDPPDPAYSHWVVWGDWPDNRVTVYPDDAQTDAVVRTDVVTVTEDRATRNLYIESGTLAIADGKTVTANGRLQVGCNAEEGYAEYAVKLGDPELVPVQTIGPFGSITLLEDSKLTVETTSIWDSICDQRRPVVQTDPDYAAGVVGEFADVPVSYGAQTPDPATPGNYPLPYQGTYLGCGQWFGNASDGEWDEGVWTPQDVGVYYVTPDGQSKPQLVEIGVFQAKAGDCNGDRTISFADFNDLANNYTGALAPGVGTKDWRQGDFDGDGDVDGAAEDEGSGYELEVEGSVGGGDRATLALAA